jgi:hypothetical protein
MAMDGFLGGALGGAATGAMLGGPIGAGVGFFAGGVMTSMQEDSAIKARKKAEMDAENARRKSLISKMGAKQQADSMALAGLRRNSGSNSGGGNNSAAQQTPGFIGAGLSTTAGTFGA